jgi:hypothetical protein
VSSPDNRGKYTLAAGEKEYFPPSEIYRTILTLAAGEKLFFQQVASYGIFYLDSPIPAGADPADCDGSTRCCVSGQEKKNAES